MHKIKPSFLICTKSKWRKDITQHHTPIKWKIETTTIKRQWYQPKRKQNHQCTEYARYRVMLLNQVIDVWGNSEGNGARFCLQSWKWWTLRSPIEGVMMLTSICVLLSKTQWLRCRWCWSSAMEWKVSRWLWMFWGCDGWSS